MKNLILYIALSLLLFNLSANAQCNNFDTQFPGGTQTTNSSVLTVVDNCISAGEFATYNVTLGETYTWTTCGDTDFDTELTLWNTAHTMDYAHNDDDCGLSSTITWTATFTGQVDVLLSEYVCSSNSLCMTIQWACTSCPTPVTSQDCEGALLVCNNAPINGNASGAGTQELNTTNSGCLGTENQSTWFYLNIGTGGTLEMTIDPSASDDYDWAIWGPYSDVTAAANCPPINSPTRCSFALGTGNTGMNNVATDNSENSSGDGWVSSLNVSDDEIYILVIDNFSASNTPFDLNWGGSAVLDCTPITLPVDLTYFNGKKKEVTNLLYWETATETNNDYFILEHSVDGFAWSEITKMNGAGNSTEINNYSFDHRDFPKTINYYRLTQVDFDGKRETFEIVSIDNSSDRKLIKTVNMIGQEVNENYKGVVIDYYDDNTVVKRYQK